MQMDLSKLYLKNWFMVESMKGNYFKTEIIREKICFPKKRKFYDKFNCQKNFSQRWRNRVIIIPKIK